MCWNLIDNFNAAAEENVYCFVLLVLYAVLKFVSFSPMTSDAYVLFYMLLHKLDDEVVPSLVVKVECYIN